MLVALAACCGNTSALSIGWRAPTYATQASGKVWDSDDANSHTRSSLLTPDGAVVVSGSATDVYSNDNIQSGRLRTIKRSPFDGHLIWSQQAEAGLGFCIRGGVAVDGNGDIIVGGTCA